jgi:transcription termination factor Rho
MPVLDRPELEASPLADLHTIANELGVDGFRRLRREELIAAILGESDQLDESDALADDPKPRARSSRRESSSSSSSSSSSAKRATRDERGSKERDVTARRPSSRSASETARTRSGSGRDGSDDARVAEGIVEVRDNGSAFLRLHPPGPSDDDIYIAPAQVKRCELKSGDKVTGPVRKPRRSERHPSLARIETINGESADTRGPGTPRAQTDTASAGAGGRRGSRSGTRTDAVESASAFPTQPLGLGSADPTVGAVERLAPLGYGSRAVIVGASRSGKTELLRRMLAALGAHSDLEVSLALVGVRPEEIVDWQAGAVKPVGALSFAASAEQQGKVVAQALEHAERAAGRGKHAVLLVDTLDGLQPDVARKALASAHTASTPGRRPGAGSLTVIGTALSPFGGETTVIALDVALAASGRFPALDVTTSGTLRPELLVGEDGAQAIRRAHASQTPAGRRWWPFGRR